MPINWSTWPWLRVFVIIVVDVNRLYYACFAHGIGATSLGLLHEDGHYDALTSLPTFFGKSYFCGRCLKPYNDQCQHACPANRTNHCGTCLQTDAPIMPTPIFTTLIPASVAVTAVASFLVPVCLDAHRLRTISSRPVRPDQPSSTSTTNELSSKCAVTL